MSARFALPAELAQRVAALASDLSGYLEDARAEFDTRSDRWRDSDRGVAVDGWLDDVDNLAETLEALPAEPE